MLRISSFEEASDFLKRAKNAAALGDLGHALGLLSYLTTNLNPKGFLKVEALTYEKDLNQKKPPFKNFLVTKATSNHAAAAILEAGAVQAQEDSKTSSQTLTYNG